MSTELIQPSKHATAIRHLRAEIACWLRSNEEAAGALAKHNAQKGNFEAVIEVGNQQIAELEASIAALEVLS